MKKESLRIQRHEAFSLIPFTVYIILCGGVVGAITGLFLQLMHIALEYLWVSVPEAISFSIVIGGMDINLYPVVMCTFGGLLIGLWQNKFGDYPRTLDETMEIYKKDKNISYADLPISYFAALLPLIFGGSIGPEAGAAGIIVGLCCWVRDKYKAGMIVILEDRPQKQTTMLKLLFQRTHQHYIGPEIMINNQSYTIPKWVRWTIYTLASVGGFISFRLIGELFAYSGLELASFTIKTFSLNELIAFLPLVIAGMLFGALFLLSQKLAAVVFTPLATHKFARAIITGMVLGVVGMFLPYTMYSGEEQMLELVNDWQSWSLIILFITGLIKMVMINVCVSGGWKGGSFFPCLFTATAIGFAISAIIPVDASFVVLIFMAAFTATALGQPIIVAVLCMLFAPIKAIIAIAVAAFIGGKSHDILKKRVQAADRGYAHH